MLLAGVWDQQWGSQRSGDGLLAKGSAGSHLDCPQHAARPWAGAWCSWKHGPKHVRPGLWQRVWGGWCSRGGPRRCRAAEGLEEKPRDESIPAQGHAPRSRRGQGEADGLCSRRAVMKPLAVLGSEPAGLCNAGSPSLRRASSCPGLDGSASPQPCLG